jgi:hypothetical protein
MQITKPRKAMKLFNVMYGYTIHTKIMQVLVCQEMMKPYCCPFQNKPHIFFSHWMWDLLAKSVYFSRAIHEDPGKTPETN